MKRIVESSLTDYSSKEKISFSFFKSSYEMTLDESITKVKNCAHKKKKRTVKVSRDTFPTFDPCFTIQLHFALSRMLIICLTAQPANALANPYQ